LDTFDNPSVRQQLEAGGPSSALNDLDGPVTEGVESVTQVGTAVGAIGKEMAKPRKQLIDRFDDQAGAIAILDIGGVDFGTDQQTAGIGDNMALASLDPLGRIVATAARRSRSF
jgi:hypothetical protein